MTVSDPRPSSTFSEATQEASPPDFAQAGFIIGCSPEGPLLTPRFYGTATAARAVFGESSATRMHGALLTLDRNKRPIGFLRARTASDGELILDTSGVTGSSVVTAAVSPTPLGDYPGVRLEVLAGGTIGQPGIRLRASISDGREYIDMGLGLATSFEWPGDLGLKVDFAAGDLNAGDVIAGYTIPPRFDTDGLEAAFAALISATNARFSLIYIDGELLPADGTTISEGLDALEEDGIFTRVIGNKRRQYREATATGTATFANADPDTIVIAGGTLLDDGFKPGMRVVVTGSNLNDGEYVKIATVTQTTITFTTNVELTDEVATPDVTLTGGESDADYGINLEEEWEAFEDTRVTLCAGLIRAVSPADGFSLDQLCAGYLFGECVAEPPRIDPGQVRAEAAGGGPVAGGLQGRIYEGTTRIHLDARKLDELVVAPSRLVALQSHADRRSGAFWVQARTQYGPSDQADTLVKGRLVDLWKAVVLSADIDDYLSGYGADPANLNALSPAARLGIQNRILAALRKRFAGQISNVDVNPEQDPENALFWIPTGIITDQRFACQGKIVTNAYILGMDNFITVRAPGQV
jgi:hypothetical protein